MIRVIGLILVAALALTGCKSGPLKKNSATGDDGTGLIIEPGLQASVETRFPDVPLPRGVKEDSERSFVYESRSLQIGRMVYTTKASMNEVSQFYIREAPKYQWTLNSVLQADGTQLMFDKAGKKMWVTVKKSTVIGGSSLLIINLTPSEPTDSGRVSTSPF